METLDEIINNATDPRETKRALTVKMLQNGLSPQTITSLLNVSEQYVSKWKLKYAQGGAAGLRLAYQGSPSYLTASQRQQVMEWITRHDTLRIEEVRDYVEEHFGVVYRSKQSYYDLLSAGNMSYHRTTPVNPKHDEEQVLAKRAEIKKSGSASSRHSQGRNCGSI